MENNHQINKIKSSYIIKNIFNFIKEDNFQMKLFFYCKLLQNKLDIKLIDYKEKYIDKLCFDINKYLHIKQEECKTDYLINKYNSFLFQKNLNKKEFEIILFDVIQNNKNDIKEHSEILIDMDSPLFKIISKTKLFGNNFAIYISQKNIDENNLKDNFKMLFE